jgi:hypothetical protein
LDKTLFKREDLFQTDTDGDKITKCNICLFEVNEDQCGILGHKVEGSSGKRGCVMHAECYVNWMKGMKRQIDIVSPITCMWHRTRIQSWSFGGHVYQFALPHKDMHWCMNCGTYKPCLDRTYGCMFGMVGICSDCDQFEIEIQDDGPIRVQDSSEDDEDWNYFHEDYYY